MTTKQAPLCPTCGTRVEGMDWPVEDVPLNEATQQVWIERRHVGYARNWPCGCEATSALIESEPNE